MKRITSRFVMLIATAAVAPLVVYGAVSIGWLRGGIEDSVEDGNLHVAEQVGRQLKLYIDTNARLLRSVGEELIGTNLAEWQQSRILKNHSLEFPEFREISLFDATGRTIATSRIGAPTTSIAAVSGRASQDVLVSRILLDEDNLPAIDLALPLRSGDDIQGWLVGRLSLEELWRLVDRVRVGTQGYALVLSEDQRIVAHGNPDEKRLAALPAEEQAKLPEVQLLRDGPEDAPSFARRYRDANGREQLAAIARVPDLNWTVIVEQPTSEAYVITTELQRQLLAAIALALLGTVVVGWIWGRSFITRIFALTSATRAIADGRLEQRVAIGGEDEIKQLGDAFNSMADRLVELHEEARKQERHVTFGRVAAGLVHDLSHPIQNIGNSCKLIVKMFDDLEYRDTFKRTVEREMDLIKGLLDDLRNIARPIPMERFPVDLDRSVSEAIESMRPHAEMAGVALRLAPGSKDAFILGDVFALGRVYRNLILNAIQATAPGGQILVETETRGERVSVRIADTGCGIPADRLSDIFEDFVTTKRRGLGLGLTISRKIVEQLDGKITVTSEVGKGTTFVLDFPSTRVRRMPVAG